MKRRNGSLAALLALTAALAIAAGASATPYGPAGTSSVASADAAQIKCGKTRSIGVAAPITGPAASLGQQQLSWARFFVSRYNRGHKNKLRIVQGDTQLPNTAEAIKVAEQFASTGSILGVVGPAGSQEVVASTTPLSSKGLAFVSGSATRTSLTDGSRRGFFFRVVPNDDVQGPTVANYITAKLKFTRVWIIDDQETYSTGLAGSVQNILRSRGVTVTRDSVSQSQSDFSSIIARIPGNTQAIYIPWQLAPKAQLFGQQLREQGKSGIRLIGSDGLFDPDNFKIAGSLVSFFPVATASKIITAYRGSHGGSSDFFGAPTYVATQVIALAVEKACKDGTATRAEVRRLVARTNIKNSLLGLRVRFTANGDLRGGAFGIYRIGTNGVYQRIG